MMVVEDDPGRPWDQAGVFTVASGVHRVPLPIPNDHLQAVNVYAIEDGATLVLVDAGVAVAESRERLETALAALGCGLPDVTRFLVTHIHYDHYSQAVALREEFGQRIELGRGEEPSLELLAGEWEVIAAGRNAHLRAYGAHDLIEELVSAGGRRPPKVVGFPDRWLDDGVEVPAGERSVRALHTPGHTQGHVVFADEGDALLFAGDHVLPHITPSIALEPVVAELPLGDYLRSLRRVRELPDLRLLPAHGPVAPSVHDRVDELIAHHDERLRRAYEHVAEGAETALAVARRLTWTRRDRSFDELDVFNRMLAVLEAGAHLDLLFVQGRLERAVVDDVYRYTEVQR
jgi:glyoxylase-like metal-dependent hydrolase (beta-lactamase superfamily II)